jgi:hypothetical protein
LKKEKAQFYYFVAIHIVALSIAFLTTGCATQNKSAGLGGAIGAGTGALLGGIADPGKDNEYRTRNVVVGAAVGGMAGPIAGSVLHDETEKQKKEAFLKGRASAPQSASSGAMPSLKSPKVESRWVEGRIQSNRYIEGHFEYIITEPARWEDSK